MKNEAWYVYQNGQQNGPMEKEEVASMLASGQVASDAFLFKGGWKDWKPLAECASEFAAATMPPPPPTSDTDERPPRATISGQIIVHNNGDLIIGSGVNISSSGIFVETSEKLFSVGEIIKLTCRVEGLSKPFNAQARVVRFHKEGAELPGYGVQFEDIETGVAAEIDLLIRGGQLGLKAQ